MPLTAHEAARLMEDGEVLVALYRKAREDGRISRKERRQLIWDTLFFTMRALRDLVD